MDPIEQRVRESLRARAGDVEPTPALYEGVQRRIARRRRRRLAAWVPAGAVALGVAVAVPIVLEGRTPDAPTIEDYADEQPVAPAAPTRVVTVDADGEVALLDLADGSTERPYGPLPGQAVLPHIDVAPEDLADVPTVHTGVVEERTDGPVLSLGYLTAEASGGGVEVGLDSRPQVAGRFAVSPDGSWTAVLTGPMEDADGWAVQLRPSDATGATAGATQEPGIVVPAGSVIQDWRDDTASEPGRTELTVVTPDGILVGFPLVLDGDSFAWPDETVAVVGDTVPVVAYASDHLGHDGGFALLDDGDGLVVQALVDAEVRGEIDVSDLVGDQATDVLALDAWGHSAVLSSPDGSWLLPQDGSGRFGDPVALPDGTVRAALVGREVTTSRAPAEGEPQSALLAFEDATLALVDLVDGDREVLLDDGLVTQVAAAPGGSRDAFRAVAVTQPNGEAARIVTFVRDGGQLSSDATSTLDLPGGSGVAPSVAISTDGRWLAYTGISQAVDAAPAVYVLPIDPADGTLDLAAAQEVHTVTVADPDDLIAELVEWTGPVGAEGDVSHLRVRGERQGGLVLERTADGFVVQQRETDGGELGAAIDVSTGFRPADDQVFTLEASEDDLPKVRFGTSGGTTGVLGVPPDDVRLDARGRTALLVGGGAAITVHFPGDDEVAFGPTIHGVVAGALLGGVGPDEGTATVPAEEVDEADADSTGLPPVVVADDRTVTLVRGDGTTQELVTFPSEGESTVVSVAVRPGSTPDDLTVALVTRAEGTFDVRYLQVAAGEVVADPAGVGFPAPPIGSGFPDGVGAFPLSAPDLQDGGELGAAWSDDGDLLAVAHRPAPDAAVQVSTIGWDSNGPSGDPNLAAAFELGTDLPLTLRSWTWTNAEDDGTPTGELLFVDQLDRRGYRARLDRQADGAPAMPARSPVEAVDRDGVLDLADTDADGTIDTLLLDHTPAPLLEWRSSEDGRETVNGTEVEAATGPRQLGRIVPLGDRVLVILDPARPQLVELATMEVTEVLLDGEVVAADAVR